MASVKELEVLAAEESMDKEMELAKEKGCDGEARGDGGGG